MVLSTDSNTQLNISDRVLRTTGGICTSYFMPGHHVNQMQLSERKREKTKILQCIRHQKCVGGMLTTYGMDI